AEFRPPANVVPMEKGRKMADLVVSGELPAAIGIEVDHADVRPLIANPKEAAYDALKKTGHYPINHLMVVKDETLAKDPSLAPRIFEAFAEAKRLYVEKLRSGTIEKPNAADETYRRVMEITGRDPLPYGIEPNRAMLEEAAGSSPEPRTGGSHGRTGAHPQAHDEAPAGGDHERGARPARARRARQRVLQGRRARHRFRDNARDGAGLDQALREVRFHLRPPARFHVQRGRHRPVPHVRVGHHEARGRGEHGEPAPAQDRGARRRDVVLRHRRSRRLALLRARDAEERPHRRDA